MKTVPAIASHSVKLTFEPSSKPGIHRAGVILNGSYSGTFVCLREEYIALCSVLHAGAHTGCMAVETQAITIRHPQDQNGPVLAQPSVVDVVRGQIFAELPKTWSWDKKAAAAARVLAPFEEHIVNICREHAELDEVIDRLCKEIAAIRKEAKGDD